MLKNSTYPYLLSLAFCCLALSSCSGWKVVDGNSAKKTVRVPYVQGDNSGELTAALTEALDDQISFCVDESGQYELQVQLLDSKEEKIGYRYDPIEREKEGKKVLILNESRAKTLAKVSLIDRHTAEVIKGPAHILGNVEYDHQENTLDNDIQDFSLGQLSDVDTIHEVRNIPIYRDLALKIALWLQEQEDLLKLKDLESKNAI